MRWKGRRQSKNVEVNRGQRPRQAAAGGLGLIVVVLIVALLGGDPMQFLQNANVQQPGAGQPAGGPIPGGAPATAEQRELDEFVSVVLADTEDVWGKLYPQMTGRRYQEPGLRIFANTVDSACGRATSATGPFYCPADRKVYLDTAFFHQLAQDLNAPGDFAQAYVIAHEVGHHIQNLLGKTDELQQLRMRLPEEEYNKYSVRLELQADFYAGVMFHHAQRDKSILEEGDIEEGLRAAAAIGDDTLQKRARGFAEQETFTHGTSDQRVRWFLKGLRTGDPTQGDTFRAKEL